MARLILAGVAYLGLICLSPGGFGGGEVHGYSLFARSNKTSAWHLLGVSGDVALKAEYGFRLFLIPAEERIARLAKQGAYMALGMTVVNE